MPLFLILLLAFRAAGQETQPTFRAGVALVKVDAQVVGRDGKTVSGLTADDFLVFDEDQPQKIVYFNRESDPLDLVLLLDVSGSMLRSIEELANTARAALGPLGDEDRVAVILFARSAKIQQEFTGDLKAVAEKIRDGVRDRSLGSGTVINANIIVAAQYLARQAETSSRPGRRAVLIVTDNQGLQFRSPDEEVVRELYAADAVLNAILIGKQRKPDAPRPGAYVNPDYTPADVFKIAEQTGGEAMEARQAARSFQEMIERIRSRYSLHYEAPAGAAGFRRIRVELSPAARQRLPRAQVNARAGYYAR